MANDDFERLIDEVALEVLRDRPDLLERFDQFRAGPGARIDFLTARMSTLFGEGDRGPRARLIPIIASWRAEREAEEVTPADALARARIKAGLPAQIESQRVAKGATGRSTREATAIASPADWALWGQMPTAMLWQAVALSLGFEPGDKWPRNDREALRFSAEYVRRFKIAEACTASGALKLSGGLAQTPGATVDLERFSSWAAGLGWTMPRELQERTAPTIAPPAAGVSAEPPEPVGEAKAATWQEEARRIAAEIFARDRANDRHPSIRELAAGVAVRMRNEKIYGRQGKPLSEATIQRQALLGFLSTGEQAANVRGKRGKRGNQ